MQIHAYISVAIAIYIYKYIYIYIYIKIYMGAFVRVCLLNIRIRLL